MRITRVFSIFCLVILMLSALTTKAQVDGKSKREQLAVQYYQNEEYEKALPIFEELFTNNRNSSYLYEYYLNTLLKLENYDDAEKMLKKQSRRFDKKLRYQVDLGYVYTLQKDEKQADKTYESVIEELPSNRDQIQIVANSFKNRGEIGFAIKTYKNGREFFNDELVFSLEMARLYRKKEDYKPMYGEYLNTIKDDPQSMGLVKGELQELVMKDKPYQQFKHVLLSKINDNPNESRFIDMLSWLFIQNEDFNAAFIQLRALQKRLGTNGRRLIQLADVARKNDALQTAKSIYEYIEGLGRSNPYYFKARQGVLDVQYDKITKLGEYTRQDLLNLEKSYKQFMNNEQFRYNDHGKVVLRLAEIKASYLDRIDEAIELLKSLTEQNLGGNKSLKAKAKLALGDYHLLKNNVWDAQLLYSQVEKMYEDHPLGHEAKFRNAKLSFYKGDFDWARTQLQILKGATSELISNDALQLGMLIKDNRGLDTTEIPLEMYAKADLYIFKKQYDKALEKLDTILSQFPDHNLTDEIFFAKAEIARERKNFDTAITYLEKVYNNYSKDILADDALFEAATIYENELKNLEKAKSLYEKIILEYKGSIYKIKARDKYRELRGDRIN